MAPGTFSEVLLAHGHAMPLTKIASAVLASPFGGIGLGGGGADEGKLVKDAIKPARPPDCQADSTTKVQKCNWMSGPAGPWPDYHGEPPKLRVLHM